MFYTQEELSSLPRKELQKLCKQIGIKANKKNSELVEELVNYFAKLQKEEQSLEKDLKTWISDDEETGTKQKESLTKDEEETESLKQQLKEEMEQRAASKIPRLREQPTAKAPNFMSPASERLKKSQKRQFDRMDSIDVYLHKKKKRIEEKMTYHSKLKTRAQESIKNMKLSHNTPGGDTRNTSPSSKRSGTPAANRRKSFYVSPFKPTTMKINKEVTFNFVSKLKSPKPFTKPAALKEQNVNTNSKKATGKTTAIQTKTTKTGIATIRKDTRKSVQFAEENKYNKNATKSRLNVTMGETIKSSPFTTTTSSNKKKTPVKFDLQASLKKRLSYKPHTGKLKDTYVRKSTDIKNVSMNSTFTLQSTKPSVKELTAKPKATRNNRRISASKRRDEKRSDMLARRRGIVC